jgi:hypothetical protein
MLRQLIRTKPAKIAAAYRGGELLVLLGMQVTGFDMIGNGAIPVAVLTARCQPPAAVAVSVRLDNLDGAVRGRIYRKPVKPRRSP